MASKLPSYMQEVDPEAYGGKKDAVLCYVRHNPNATAAQVYDALVKMGIDIARQTVHVYMPGTVGHTVSKRGRKKSGEFTVTELMQAKAFVQQVGSFELAEDALNALHDLSV